MIVNKDTQSDAVVIGDIKSNGVSIDVNNIDFIVTILSTNLYSNPVESFIRETVSNAWDSHVEANIQLPVVIELGKNSQGKVFCAIRDFGIGLSPERFDSVYRNIGSSTKRGDNTQIGGFGIGRFSALACSDTVYITSNFEGKQYKYLMYKDGNKVNIDLLSTLDTDLKNGLEVLIYIKESDVHSYSSAIRKQLPYFENIYVEVNGLILPELEKFNQLTIKNYKNFSVNTSTNQSNSISILLGKVKYPLRTNILTKNYPKDFLELPIALRFEIGDLEITPNREEIIYSNSTVAKIEKLLDASLQELKDIFGSTESQDCKNFDEYITLVEEVGNYLLVEDSFNKLYFKANFISKKNYTYYGYKVSSSALRRIKDNILYISFKEEFEFSRRSGMIRKSTVSYSLESIHKKSIEAYFCNLGSESGILKDFIRATFERSHFFTPNFKIYLRTVTKRIEKYCSDKDYLQYTLKLSKEEAEKFYYLVAKQICREILKEAKILTSKDITLDYLAERKRILAEKKAVRQGRIAGEIKAYVLDKDLRNTQNIVERGKDIKVGVPSKFTYVYAIEVSSAMREIALTLRKYHNFIFCRIAKSNLKLVEKDSHFIEFKTFLSMKHRILKNYITATYIEKEYPLLFTGSFEYLKTINKDLYNKILKLRKFYYDFKIPSNKESFTEAFYKFGIENNLLNLEILAEFNFVKSKIQKLDFIQADSNLYRNGTEPAINNLITDYIVARKIFRPDYEKVISAKRFIKENINNKN